VYIPYNAPIAIPRRRIVFGRPESGDEAIEPSVEGERAGDGDSDSIRVEAALLAGESQRVRYRRRTRVSNLPVSSRPPIQLERHPYGHARHRRRRGRLKIERINISQMKQVETTYLERTSATQPHGNAPNHAYGIYGPRRQRGHIKIEPINISRALEIETTHLGRAIAMRSTWRPKKRIRRVNKLTFKYRMPGEYWRNDGDYR